MTKLAEPVSSMKNIDLNPGGIAGALAGLFLPSIIYAAATQKPPFDLPLAASGTLAFFGGVSGNRLWQLAFR